MDSTAAAVKGLNCVQVFEEIDHVKLQGSIDWKINDILDWVAFLDKRGHNNSSRFKFDFPEVKKKFQFSLKLSRPKPDKKDPDDLKDFVSLYLKSYNPEKLKVTYESYFQGKDGIKYNSSGKFSVVFEAYSKRKRCESWGFEKYFSIPKLKEHAEDVLENGSLNIVFDFTIFHSVTVNTNTKRPNSNHKECQLRPAMEKLLSTQMFSDFHFVCQDQVFPCHRNIIANCSEVLEKMLLAQNWTENEKKTLKIQDFEPETVKLMIHFIYTQQLPEGSRCDLNLLLIADKYDLKDLVKFCEDELSNNLEVENAFPTLEVASQVNSEYLNSFVIGYISKNLGAFLDTPTWKDIVLKDPEMVNAILRKRTGKIITSNRTESGET